MKAAIDLLKGALIGVASRAPQGEKRDANIRSFEKAIRVLEAASKGGEMKNHKEQGVDMDFIRGWKNNLSQILYIGDTPIHNICPSLDSLITMLEEAGVRIKKDE